MSLIIEAHSVLSVDFLLKGFGEMPSAFFPYGSMKTNDDF